MLSLLARLLCFTLGFLKEECVEKEAKHNTANSTATMGEIIFPDPPNMSRQKTSVGFPVFGTAATGPAGKASDWWFVACGGGGAAKTGVSNGIRFLRVADDSTSGAHRMAVVAHHDTGDSLPTSVAASYETDGALLVAYGIKGTCRVARAAPADAKATAANKAATKKDDGGDDGGDDAAADDKKAAEKKKKKKKKTTAEKNPAPACPVEHLAVFDTEPDEATNYLNCVAFSPEGRLLATGGDGGVLRVWKAPRSSSSSGGGGSSSGGSGAGAGCDDAEPAHVMKGHTKAIKDLAWHPGGTLLASVAGDRTCRLWTVRGAKELQCLGADAKSGLQFVKCAFSPGTGLHLYLLQASRRRGTGSYLTQYKARNMPGTNKFTYAPARSARVDRGPSCTLAVSGDGAFVAVGMPEGHVSLFGTAAGQGLAHVRRFASLHALPVSGLAFLGGPAGGDAGDRTRKGAAPPDGPVARFGKDLGDAATAAAAAAAVPIATSDLVTASVDYECCALDLEVAGKARRSPAVRAVLALSVLLLFAALFLSLFPEYDAYGLMAFDSDRPVQFHDDMTEEEAVIFPHAKSEDLGGRGFDELYPGGVPMPEDEL